MRTNHCLLRYGSTIVLLRSLWSISIVRSSMRFDEAEGLRDRRSRLRATKRSWPGTAAVLVDRAVGIQHVDRADLVLVTLPHLRSRWDRAPA
jgi:hypothetical protein